MNIYRLSPLHIIFCLVFICNYWFFQLINTSILLVILLFILGTIFVLTKKVVTSSRIFLLTLFIFLCLILIIGFINNFDKTIFEKRGEHITLYGQRHHYYAESFGKLFENKYTLLYYTQLHMPISNYIENVSYGIDPNVYFFGGHPRERKGVDEFEKFSILFLPFFLLGIFLFLKQVNLLHVLFLVLIVLFSGVIQLGYVLYFPFISYVIAQGIFMIFVCLKKGKFGYE